MKYEVRIFIILLISLAFLTGCGNKASRGTIVRELNTNHAEAVGPYFTQDNEGHRVLCWTERDTKDSLFSLKYAIYNSDANSFGEPVTVQTSKGTSTSSESMGKIGFKADGTVFAVYAKPFKNEKNPFAGAIYYSFSTDRGATWSARQFLHSDTAHHYGRSFFDLATLKNGELGVIWLDGRFGKSITGSSLFFASTQKGKGFENERCLAKGTCQCCRTDIVGDKNGNIHIAYRNILFPNALTGEQVRDMVYIGSRDAGRTFSRPKLISNDNWKIDGCPHSGPALTVAGSAVNAVWFTAGGSSGLYRTSSSDSSSHFETRTLLSSGGRHPQITSLEDGSQVIVYEETLEPHSQHAMKSRGSHKNTAGHHPKPGNAKITLAILRKTREVDTIFVTDGTHADHHAVLTELDGGVLTSWIREEEGQSRIFYSITGIENE